MNKLYAISTFFIIFLTVNSVYAQFPYASGLYYSLERSIIYYNYQEFTTFPNSLESYGCPRGYDSPRDLVVRDPAGNPFVTFSGGMRMGRFAHAPCFNSMRSSYATTKVLEREYNTPTNLTDTITITFPNPVKFSDVFIEGKPDQQIRVTLDGGTLSTTINLTADRPYESVNWYDFAGISSAPVVSTITIKSLSDNWNFEVYSVSTFRPPGGGGSGTGTGGEPPPPPDTPLVFVPGIAGSKLRLNPGTVNSEIRWLPSSLHASLNDPLGLSVLALDSSGESVNNIDVPDIIRDDPVATVSSQNVYKTLIDRLTNTKGRYKEYEVDDYPYFRTLAGCKTNQTPKPTLFVFAYDWRKNNAQNTAALKEYIDCVRLIYHDVNPNQKVNIVAHSMGGLLSRRYILDYPNDNNVKKLITVNSPFLGAPRAIHVMETGSFLSGAYDSVEAPSFISARVMRNLANNFKGAHELLPSLNYFRLTPNIDTFSELSSFGSIQHYGYTETTNWLNAKHPISLPANTMASFHDYVNPQGNKQEDWSNDTTGVQYFHIYSKQRTNRTVGGVRVENYTLCNDLEIDCIGSVPIPGTLSSIGTRYRPFPTEGDGTVALPSARRVGNGIDLNYRQNSLDNPFRFIMKPNDSETDVAADHNESLKNPRILNEIVRLLKGDTNYELNIDLNTSFAKLDEEPQSPSYFVTLTNIKRLRFGENERPRSIDFNTKFVGTSGLSGSSESIAIPTGENSAWIATPGYAEETINFKNDGTPMEIEIVKGVDYETATDYIKYSNLVLPANVAISLKVSPDGIEDVHYDADNDGYPETVLSPTVYETGTLAKDINQPVLSYNLQQQGFQHLLTLAATDTESGLRQIRYSTDGQHFYPYTNPVLINPAQFQKVYAFAEDNNRNKTGISTINIPLSPTASNASVSGRIINQKNRGISQASVTITATNGTLSKTVRTNPLGYFNFADIPSGTDYIISVRHKKYTFNSQVLSVQDNVADLILTAN
jgi:Lecithin:cholesterol acyltransferase/Carboxypeptidase regulatory-like domain